METAIYGKNKPPEGKAPAIVMVRPKYPYNVGAAVRAASCFGIKQVWFTGDRVSLSPNEKYRLPREERMRGYKEVELRQYEYVFDMFPKHPIIAVEVVPTAVPLPYFQHPARKCYNWRAIIGNQNICR